MIGSTGKRIQLLTDDEIEELYQLPVFSQAEREEYFSLDDSLLDIVNGLLKAETKIYMILLIGYFRAKPVIPRFRLCDAEEDTRLYLRHLQNRYTKVGLDCLQGREGKDGVTNTLCSRV